ncbi:methyltransferase domain-containing protein [Altererythrobacter salegens]|uniref:Methyltransferase domain-containing protein n=1 Tax=Croceibacterium salegens TaxID=1737568 RepID=A0A6I4SSZ0_9SPHN|nr:class I SAM-dependent methyltransferase [Croceibacterium salegens]MXO58117.1 methyltransferase domain-containing protein [Croceibacterium salegens]
MTLTRQEISLIAHAGHPIACPLSDATVAALIDALGLPGGARVLDVGCGEGEWLARLSGRELTLCGVDLSAPALARAEGRLGPAVRLVEAPAAEFLAAEERWDAILCNGACHALGGAQSALGLLAERLAPGGALLFSDGFWQERPSPAALAALGATESDIPYLSQVFAAIETAGLRVESIALSSQQEWEDYETAWCAGAESHAERIASSAPDDAAQLREAARRHRAEYLDGYRGVLGYFAVIAHR